MNSSFVKTYPLAYSILFFGYFLSTTYTPSSPPSTTTTTFSDTTYQTCSQLTPLLPSLFPSSSEFIVHFFYFAGIFCSLLQNLIPAFTIGMIWAQTNQDYEHYDVVLAVPSKVLWIVYSSPLMPNEDYWVFGVNILGLFLYNIYNTFIFCFSSRTVMRILGCIYLFELVWICGAILMTFSSPEHNRDIILGTISVISSLMPYGCSLRKIVLGRPSQLFLSIFFVLSNSIWLVYALLITPKSDRIMILSVAGLIVDVADLITTFYYNGEYED